MPAPLKDVQEIPEAFNEHLLDAGYDEEEFDAMIAAEKSKGKNPRVDYLLRSIKRDLPDFYVLREASSHAQKEVSLSLDCEKNISLEAAKTYQKAKDELDAFLAEMDGRVTELVKLVFPEGTDNSYEKMMAMEDLRAAL